MQREGRVERCPTVTGRGETGIDRAGPPRGVRKVLRGEPRAVDRARLSLVRRPPRGPRPRAGDTHPCLAAMGGGLRAPKPRGVGTPCPLQPVREPVAETQSRAISGISLSRKQRPVIYRGFHYRRGAAGGRASPASAPRPRSARRGRPFSRGDCRGNGSPRRNRPLMALTLPQDNSSAAH
jgi:hypothetical protein